MTPTDISPIDRLLPYVPGSLLTVAPERSAALPDRLEGVKLEIVDGPAFEFAAYHWEPRITACRRGIEYLWTIAYSMWAMAEVYQANKQQAMALQYHSDPRTAHIPILLKWALTNQQTPTRLPWPSGTPTPALLDGPSPSIEQVASELTLVATAWILHHELSHIAHKHDGNDPASVANERLADSEATEWLLGAAPETALYKRGMGIAVGIVGLSGLALSNARRPDASHPHPASRIFDALQHSRLQPEQRVPLVASLHLSAHMQAYSHPVPPGPFEDAYDMLQSYCIALSRLAL